MQRAKTTYQNQINQFSVFDWIGGSQVNNPGIRSRPRGLKEAVKVLRGGGGRAAPQNGTGQWVVYACVTGES